MRFCLCCFALLLACAKAGAAPLSDPQLRAVHVLNRLSFGIQPGDVARVSAIGVDAYIDAQLHPERISLPEALTRQLNQLDLLNTPISDLIAQMQDMKQATPSDNNNNTRRDLGKQLYRQAATARMLNALQSPRQLEEVMVDFWFNHFNVFDGKGMDKILIAAYERDAIRPHVLGHFGELLRATAKHPAMLFYLDNWLSVAPLTSLPHAGSKQRSTGLNENYARELMELHTLGVEGGYTQQDVTELARILTGWSFKPQTGAFAFLPQRHDTGTKIWLGQRIDSQGMAEGEYALDM